MPGDVDESVGLACGRDRDHRCGRGLFHDPAQGADQPGARPPGGDSPRLGGPGRKSGGGQDRPLFRRDQGAPRNRGHPHPGGPPRWAQGLHRPPPGRGPHEAARPDGRLPRPGPPGYRGHSAHLRIRLSRGGRPPHDGAGRRPGARDHPQPDRPVRRPRAHPSAPGGAADHHPASRGARPRPGEGPHREDRPLGVQDGGPERRSRPGGEIGPPRGATTPLPDHPR